ncbi:stage III sporulation protein AA [Aureibacillus halotolerans]|uniref:Stage III sporulation protein AA n=1 Tax=Aureibacillus halotolerans TaxID=1508390 RepID=A0A4R6U7B2_9BACI|nr:stage III sporulation protein AA [Aureibacillus halotolerans]TDQ41656.1 stage III sporulation protein AA [Aureibacillus halotolerans]
MNHVLSLLPHHIQESLSLQDQPKDELEEIRLRVDKPVEFIYRSTSLLVPSLFFDKKDAHTFLQRLTEFSMYAHENDIKQGYITFSGGHRVGLCGTAVIENDTVQVLRDISSFNIRIAHERVGAANPIAALLFDRLWQSTLVLGAPKAGKTTMIRDIARLMSEGLYEKWPSITVGIVDERSEIAASASGVPQHTFGPKVDVLDSCPKALGMMMMIRSMSPDMLVVDEIGREEDARAILEALHSGVKVVASAHAANYEDFIRRPGMKELMDYRPFERIVELGSSPTGSILAVKNSAGEALALKALIQSK